MNPRVRPVLKFLIAAAALGAVLMTSITIRRVWACADGPDLNVYGAPLAWHHFSEVSSMESTVSLENLALDWLFHVVLAAGLLWFARRSIAETQRLALWVAPCFLLAALQLAPVFLMNVHFGLRGDHATVDASLQFGIAGPAYP